VRNAKWLTLRDGGWGRHGVHAATTNAVEQRAANSMEGGARSETTADVPLLDIRCDGDSGPVPD